VASSDLLQSIASLLGTPRCRLASAFTTLASIDRKTFSAHEAFAHAAAHDTFKHVPKYIALTKAAMSFLGESRMIRHRVF
jgi:hypothetical protein